MTAGCTDADVGKLLHPYELGHLTKTERDRFEAHLLGCEYCAQELQVFERAADTLISSVDVRAMSAAYAQERPSYLVRLRRALWPQERLLLRPALAWGLVVLLLFPAYLGIRSGPGEKPEAATTILLTGTRSVSVSPAADGRPIVLYFRVPNHRAGASYEITLVSEAGLVIHREADFDLIDDREMGTLLIPPRRISGGAYRLVINGSDGQRIYEYSFTIAETP
jgi:hypothetical protein